MPLWTIKPKGSLIRNNPEWNLEYAAVAYGYVSANSTTTPYIALYNNDSIGRKYYIYSIDPDFINETGCFVETMQGTFGTFDHNSRPIVVPGPNLSGAIYYNTVTSWPQGIEWGLVNPRTDANPWSGAPLMVLYPGWSVLVRFDEPTLGSDQVVNTLPVTFWYLVML